MHRFDGLFLSMQPGYPIPKIFQECLSITPSKQPEALSTDE
jgi:hypothetical protein